MSAARWFQSGAAHQAQFEEAQRNARADAVRRSRDDLLGAAHELNGAPGPLASAAAALFVKAATEGVDHTSVDGFAPWVTKAVRDARAVLLGDRGRD